MVYETTRAEDETVETVLGVELLDLVEKTCDDVVTTRSLTTAKDNTHIHLLRVGLGSGLKLYDGHTIGIGEEFLDFLLITYTLSGLTFLNLHSTLKRLGELRLISGSGELQCTFFHILLLLNDDKNSFLTCKIRLFLLEIRKKRG